jgi:hypothetical protein
MTVDYRYDGGADDSVCVPLQLGCRTPTWQEPTLRLEEHREANTDIHIDNRGKLQTKREGEKWPPWLLHASTVLL